MNNLPTVVFASLGVTLSLVAFFTVMGIFFPNRVARTQSTAETRPGRSFAVGLVNLLFFGAAVIVLFSLSDRLHSPVVRLIATVGLALLSVAVSFGLAGVVRLVGLRLTGRESGLAPMAWGTVLLALACALPFIGWFGLLPYAAALGLGSFIVSFFRQPVSS